MDTSTQQQQHTGETAEFGIKAPLAGLASFLFSLSEPPTQLQTTKSSAPFSLRRYGPQLRRAFIFIKALITSRVLRKKKKQLGTLATIRSSTCTVVTKKKTHLAGHRAEKLRGRYKLSTAKATLQTVSPLKNPGYNTALLDPCMDFSLFCQRSGTVTQQPRSW